MNLKQAADKVISEWFITGGYPDTTEERRLIAEAIHELQKASAAAPQVVADERAWVQNLELVIDRLKGIMHFFPKTHAETLADEALICARSALAAAPVQAQEPVAWKFVMLGELHFQTERPDKGETKYACTSIEPLYRAPVQPVAVPDALWTLERCNDVCGYGKQCTEACLAAPAAQGDAKELTDAEIVAIAKSLPFKPWGIGSRIRDAIAFARAAIAAKAAS